MEQRSRNWSGEPKLEWGSPKWMNHEAHPIPKQYNELANQQDSIYNVDYNWNFALQWNEALAVELGAVILQI